MAERVFLHVGIPKSGTTYLQDLLWANRDVLRDQGILLPGRSKSDHLFASRAIRGHDVPGRDRRSADEALERVLSEVRAWQGTAIISHEAWGVTTAKRAQRFVDLLGAAEVHVVVTARDLARAYPSLWQQSVKIGGRIRLSEFEPERASRNSLHSWRAIDAADVLRRWGTAVPDENIHVVTMNPNPRDPVELWERFASVVGIDTSACSSQRAAANPGLGLVETELMLRVNRVANRGAFVVPLTRARWLRDYLADQVLVPRGGERATLRPEQVAMIQERSAAVVKDLGRYDVVGDLDDLVTREVRVGRDPSSVTDTEILDAAADAVAHMLSDVRDLAASRRDAQRRIAAAERTLAELRAVEPPAPPEPRAALARRRVRRLAGRARAAVLRR